MDNALPMCTWRDCTMAANHPQVDSDGEVWANLCDDHKAEFEMATTPTGDTFNPQAVLSAWIKAQGGAKKAARRM